MKQKVPNSRQTIASAFFLNKNKVPSIKFLETIEQLEFLSQTETDKKINKNKLRKNASLGKLLCNEHRQDVRQGYSF